MTGLLCIAAALLLVYAALHDLAARTVPNWLPLALLSLGLPLRLLDHSLLAGLAVAAATFLVLFGIWLLGVMGGGDVKLWAATALLIPPLLSPQLGFCLRVIVAGGVLAMLYLGLRLALGHRLRRPRRASSSLMPRLLRVEAWRIGRRAPLPYACAIAAGAMLTFPPLSFQVW